MTCALYRHYDATGQLLYVGVSSNLKHRNSTHRARSPWFSQVARTAVVWLADRAEALIAERDAIIAEKPIHNIQSANKTRGAAVFIDAIGKDELAAAIGVTFYAVRQAHWRDRLPAPWALTVAHLCVERGVYCPMHAFAWRGLNGDDLRCVSEVMFPSPRRQPTTPQKAGGV